MGQSERQGRDSGQSTQNRGLCSRRVSKQPQLEETLLFSSAIRVSSSTARSRRTGRSSNDPMGVRNTYCTLLVRTTERYEYSTCATGVLNGWHQMYVQL